ncbi:hypothetical protein [Phenylobacterium soli]|uniref:Calcineurin-like phosphoesterase domain-containing protein n=1 Tax=Phenylobacterium soli TaxID=2170551 RepID=A0A328A9W6_9CAUL|nr:hypothetical protein [Phenylobacterium soli]RAK51187.1 hypothetical protein DJ017_19710 [Phenylobacterium soli]
MPTPPLRRELAEEAVARVEAQLRAGCVPLGFGGGKSAVEAAARQALEDGWINTVHAFANRVEAARKNYGLEPDWTLYRPARPQQPTPSVMLREAPAPEPSLAVPSGEPVQVLVIPDRHNDPRHEHRLACTTWIARLGSERRPSVVVDLGDAGTFDSCSRHDKNDTLRGRLKPSIRADLDNHLASLQAFEAGRAADWKPKRIKTRGNHEQRLWAFENEHPESEGTHTHTYAEHLLQFGWRERPFGELAYVEGVAFTHAPINGMGRPMGGKTATHRAGAMLTSALVHGHTHQLQVFNDAKMGHQERISVIQAGCALPWGEYESYAMTGPGGWWWGCLMLTVWGGQIVDFEAISMLRLRDRYSGDGADRRAA